MKRRFRLGLGLMALLGAGYLWLVFATRTAPDALPGPPSDSTVAAPAVSGFQEPPGGRAAFSLHHENVPLPYRHSAVFILPGEAVHLRVQGAARPLTAQASGGSVAVDSSGVVWQPPAAPGSYRLSLRDARGARAEITPFVYEPFNVRATVLNGYAIGQYPRAAYGGNPLYAPPEGLVAVRSPAEAAVPVSPHFTLGQFLCKQPGGYPKYLLVHPRLLLKLEALLERVRAAGYAVETLFVMSGYRTPQYNAAIGNETTFSAHLYGLAADVFVDADADGTMDDLDGDGQITAEDARVLYRLAEPLDTLYGGVLAGGLGLYAPAPHRGPFIHLDVRGTSARW